MSSRTDPSLKGITHLQTPTLNRLFKFNEKEKLQINNKTVSYGTMDYINKYYTMFGCINYGEHYFTLEHFNLIPDKSVFICDFYESNHYNYGKCETLETDSDEKEKKEFLIKFVKDFLEKE